MTHPKVFVIILAHNSREVIGPCLKSVARMSYPNFEVIIVDNNSVDGTLEFAKNLFPRFHYIKNRDNIGFAKGNNVAIRYALEKMADYVFLLNPDTVVKHDTLPKLVDEAGRQPAGISSPVVFDGNTENIWFAGGKIRWLAMKAIHARLRILPLKPYPTEFVSGCAMLIDRKVFEKIGLFDERYFLYYEDTDLSLRARKKGFPLLVVPSASIRHFESSRVGETKTYWLVFSGLLFFNLHARWFLKIYYLFYLLVRKIKNKRDIEIHRNGSAYIVNRAYKDYASFKRN